MNSVQNANIKSAFLGVQIIKSKINWAKNNKS